MPRPVAPPPHFIPSCIQVTLHWASIDGQFSNVLHGRYGGTPAPSGAFANTLFSAILAAAQTVQWLTRISLNVELTGLSLKDLRTADQPVYVSTIAGAPGTEAGAQLPINAALVVTHRTGQSGRMWRGRSYLGGLTGPALLNSRTFADATSNDGVAFLEGIQGVFNAQGMPMVVAQPRLMEGTDSNGNTLPERPANVVNIERFEIANPRVDTQRRRLGR